MNVVIRKDSDLWRRLSRGALGGRVLVGIPEGAGNHTDSNASMAQIAQWQHDGTSSIYPRPFLSRPLDGRKKEVKEIVGRVAKGVLEGKLSDVKGLQLLGVWAQIRVIAFINSNIPPALAPSTVARKSSSLALVDTNQLKSSIKFYVDLTNKMVGGATSDAAIAEDNFQKALKKQGIAQRKIERVQRKLVRAQKKTARKQAKAQKKRARQIKKLTRTGRKVAKSLRRSFKNFTRTLKRSFK